MKPVGAVSGWSWSTIGEVADVTGGLTKNKGRREASSTRVPLVSVAAVHLRRIVPEAVGEVGLLPSDGDRATLASGDLLIVEGNGSLEHIGRVALWNDDVPGARHQNHIIRVRPREVSPRLLLEWLASPSGRDAIVNEATSGAGLYTLSLSKVERLPVPVPPLPEQRRIVTKLEALQARSRRAREALDAVPPLLEKLRQSILAAAFRGDLTAEWRAKHPDVEPASELLKRIRVERRKKWEEAELAKMVAKGKAPKDDKWKAKYEEPKPVDAAGLPGLPRGWAWASLESLTDADRGIPYGIVLTGDPVENGVPTVRCGDIKGFDIELSSLKRVNPAVAAEFERTRLLGGEVLIAIRGTVGATAVAGEAMVGMNISREVAMIPLLSGLTPRYLMFCLAGPEAEARVMGHVKGVAQSGINLSDLRALPVPVAPFLEQAEVLVQLEGRLATCATLDRSRRATSESSSALDRAILAKAFRGELVPQDPADEPVSLPSAATEEEPESKPTARTPRRGKVPAPARKTRKA